ncbi:hypothetical protein FBD94_02980 [Pedobacter hiemivivus]|uniref:Uncharacterized protein n=1 Tax=Pedobacter hiemivivus TaxID=2530454 RepID=A0A4R0N8Z4_9SPHI|nr:hypothetical protein EZ444_13280 [Pedobacter hiemivivus]TKC65528.1 hypothetical protein FBD94_02980 [Pedobacter hiemivivus]
MQYWKFRSIILFLKPIWRGSETFLVGTASCRIEVEGIDELYREFSSQQVLHKEHPEVTNQQWGHRD